MGDLAALRVAKQAMDEGLIHQQDYDMVKVAFLKAQQIKAGLDAGFIQQGDYDKARDAYLHALDFSIMASFPAMYHTQNHAQAAPPAVRTVSEPSAILQNAAVAPAPSLPAAAAAPPPAAKAPPPAAAAPPPAAAPAAMSASEPQLPMPPAVRTSSFSALSAAAAGGAAAGLHSQQSGASSAAPSGTNTPRANAGNGSTVEMPADIPQYAKNMDFTKVSMCGIGLREECVNMFLHMKTRSAFKWIIYRLDDGGKTVIPEQWATRGSTYNDFVAALPEQQCRYAVYDYQLSLDGRGSFNKLVFVNWAPADCPVRQKMMFASTKDFFKRYLDGIGAELQATDRGELSESEMKDKVLTYIGAGGKV